jgi:hypothetical protein
MMRLQRGIVLSLLVTSAALGACKSSTSSNPCADFQGTWDSQSFVYTASADPTISFDASSVGAAITLTVDDNCNYTGTANIPTITTSATDIHGSFTLDSDSTLTLNDATAVGQAINNTYQYTLSGSSLTLVNPSTTFDFDGTGPSPAIPATVTITFLKQ